MSWEVIHGLLGWEKHSFDYSYLLSVEFHVLNSFLLKVSAVVSFSCIDTWIYKSRNQFERLGAGSWGMEKKKNTRVYILEFFTASRCGTHFVPSNGIGAGPKRKWLDLR